MIRFSVAESRQFRLRSSGITGARTVRIRLESRTISSRRPSRRPRREAPASESILKSVVFPAPLGTEEPEELAPPDTSRCTSFTTVTQLALRGASTESRHVRATRNRLVSPRMRTAGSEPLSAWIAPGSAAAWSRSCRAPVRSKLGIELR
jgi:hypothetical protein